MWRNCPGRRRKQTRQTTVSTDMDFMENFEPMNRWIDELLQFLMVFLMVFLQFSLRHTSGIHLDPRRYIPQELAIDTTLDYWTLLDTAGHCWTLDFLVHGNRWKSWNPKHTEKHTESRHMSRGEPCLSMDRPHILSHFWVFLLCFCSRLPTSGLTTSMTGLILLFSLNSLHRHIEIIWNSWREVGSISIYFIYISSISCRVIRCHSQNGQTLRFNGRDDTRWYEMHRDFKDHFLQITILCEDVVRSEMVKKPSCEDVVFPCISFMRSSFFSNDFPTEVRTCFWLPPSMAGRTRFPWSVPDRSSPWSKSCQEAPQHGDSFCFRVDLWTSHIWSIRIII